MPLARRMAVPVACAIVGVVMLVPAPAQAENPYLGTSGNGYWVLDAAGGVFSHGDAAFHGSVPGLRQTDPSIGGALPVAITATKSGGGYWILDKAGGMFSFGDARFFGSVPQLRNSGVPIGPADPVDLEVTATGNGYWILDKAGGIFSFGDAAFFGSVPDLRNRGVQIGQADPVDLAATPSGNGYWILDKAGGIFSFGDASFFGSVPSLRDQGVAIGQANMIGMAPSTSGAGYRLIDDAGGIFSFGDVSYHGSLPELRAQGQDLGAARTVDAAASPSGNGYWMLNGDGRVVGFGDARNCGSPSPSAPAISIAVPANSSLVQQRLAHTCGASDSPVFSANSPWHVAGTGRNCYIEVDRGGGGIVRNSFAHSQLLQIRESGSFFLKGDTDCAFVALPGNGGVISRPFTIGTGGGDSRPFIANSAFTITASGQNCYTAVHRDSDGKLLTNKFGSDYTMNVTDTGTLFADADTDCVTTVNV